MMAVLAPSLVSRVASDVLYGAEGHVDEQDATRRDPEDAKLGVQIGA